MTAVTSATDNDNYLFFLPIVHWCWRQLGVDTHFIIPKRIKELKKFKLVLQYTQGAFYQTFRAPLDKEITYAQVARLFVGNEHPLDEVLITTDADMIVLNNVFEIDDDRMHILGSDLVPEKQQPLCYGYGRAAKWAEVMKIGDRDMQTCLDDDLGSVECDHFAGNYWSHDQDLLYRALEGTDAELIPRAYPGTQFATRRIDRSDGMWETFLKKDTIDFHVFRPGYEPENFSKIMRVLHYFYPDEDLKWIVDYRNEYLKLV